MALKITATLIVRKGDAANQALSQNPELAEYEVRNYLRNNLPTDLPLAGLTVEVTEVKRDGTPKKDNEGFDYVTPDAVIAS